MIGALLNPTIVRTARGIPAAVGIPRSSIAPIADRLDPVLKRLGISHETNPTHSIENARTLVYSIDVSEMKFREGDAELLRLVQEPEIIFGYAEKRAIQAERDDYKMLGYKTSSANPRRRAEAIKESVERIRQSMANRGIPEDDWIPPFDKEDISLTSAENYFKETLLPQIKSAEEKLRKNFSRLVLAQRLFGAEFPRSILTEWPDLRVRTGKRQSLLEVAEMSEGRTGLREMSMRGCCFNVAGRYVSPAAKATLEVYLGSLIYSNKQSFIRKIRLLSHESQGIHPFNPKAERLKEFPSKIKGIFSSRPVVEDMPHVKYDPESGEFSFI